MCKQELKDKIITKMTTDRKKEWIRCQRSKHLVVAMNTTGITHYYVRHKVGSLSLSVPLNINISVIKLQLFFSWMSEFYMYKKIEWDRVIFIYLLISFRLLGIWNSQRMAIRKTSNRRCRGRPRDRRCGKGPTSGVLRRRRRPRIASNVPKIKSNQLRTFRIFKCQ